MTNKIKVKDLKIGDIVIGNKSMPELVTKISSLQNGNLEIYFQGFGNLYQYSMIFNQNAEIERKEK